MNKDRYYHFKKNKGEQNYEKKYYSRQLEDEYE